MGLPCSGPTREYVGVPLFARVPGDHWQARVDALELALEFNLPIWCGCIDSVDRPTDRHGSGTKGTGWYDAGAELRRGRVDGSSDGFVVGRWLTLSSEATACGQLVHCIAWRDRDGITRMERNLILCLLWQRLATSGRCYDDLQTVILRSQPVPGAPSIRPPTI